MAARFWRSVLGGELALAAAIAVIVGAARHWPASLTLLVALSALALLRFLLVSSGFILACTAARDGSFGAGLGRVVWTLIRECFHFGVAQWRMCAEPYRHLHDVEPPPEGQPARPVLLIHGLLCNRAVWRPVLARLRSAGFAPIRALDLEPLFSDIESHIAGVERELRALQHRSNAMPVSIVAHSTGGLVARAVLRSVSPGFIGRIVTIATPHHGTVIACRYRSPATLQLRPGSAWLRSLNAAQEPAPAVPFTCIYSLEDELIAPARSAALAGTQLHELRGIGHFELLHSRGVIEHIVTALNRA
ncbi:MAG TPA: hypothetical protein VN757_00435 [Steroidobacteraceae bacterium]|nr:hypothetical protein [Steroidobacteraceae bacterium]